MSSSQPSPPPTPKRRRRLVGVSTKMYFSHARTSQFITSFLDIMQHHTPTNIDLAAALASKIDIFIIPDYLSLPFALDRVRAAAAAAATNPPENLQDKDAQGQVPKPQVLIGAQNCHWEDSGPFTGEVSPAVLSEIGCNIVELNHAERRRYFNETDSTAAKKAQAVMKSGMIPLICVGEGSPGQIPAQREVAIKKAAEEVVRQVENCLDGVDPTKEVWLAYEPVWAIGAKEPAGVEHVRGVVRAMRRSEVVKGREERGGMTRILYGGSAGPGLFGRLKEEDDEEGVDGLFLGRFAHEEGQFWRTVCEVAEVEGEGEGR